VARKRSLRSMTIVVFSLLTLNALEEILLYKLQRANLDPYVFTGILLVMFGVGFALFAGVLLPRVKDVVKGAHRASKKTLGLVGVIAFFAGLFVFYFWMYFVIYVRGPQYLLPPAWR
jgi:hypothetical protein